MLSCIYWNSSCVFDHGRPRREWSLNAALRTVFSLTWAAPGVPYSRRSVNFQSLPSSQTDSFIFAPHAPESSIITVPFYLVSTWPSCFWVFHQPTIRMERPAVISLPSASARHICSGLNECISPISQCRIASLPLVHSDSDCYWLVRCDKARASRCTVCASALDKKCTTTFLRAHRWEREVCMCVSVMHTRRMWPWARAYISTVLCVIGLLLLPKASVGIHYGITASFEISRSLVFLFVVEHLCLLSGHTVFLI